jgi:hypothetical protein
MQNLTLIEALEAARKTITLLNKEFVYLVTNDYVNYAIEVTTESAYKWKDYFSVYEHRSDKQITDYFTKSVTNHSTEPPSSSRGNSMVKMILSIVIGLTIYQIGSAFIRNKFGFELCQLNGGEVSYDYQKGIKTCYSRH